ncbi:xanthine dehydrogenase family protein molybdopterin-binding subunit [Fulvimarina sp. MAC3]|uniref:xanthine dehydrogenase family protein molybdopterin-binding subunit n=1 Tax=Fulvimarina sp. MAC3 TaxID=3148887 RepID=UPI0031FCAD6E
MSETAITSTTLRQRHGSNAGQPMTRRDGLDKVTGAAPYAADRRPDGLLHAVYAAATISSGRVTALDVMAAKAHPGVVAVLTSDSRPPLAGDPDAKSNPLAFRLDMLQSKDVRYAGQPIAVVVAETLEAATEGAALLDPQYETATPRVGLDVDGSFVPQAVGPGFPPEASVGDVESGLSGASTTIEALYETPPQYHNAMEPHAIVAEWDGDRLTVDTPSQGMAMTRARLSELFGIPAENILVRSPYLGGGFGSKGSVTGPVALGVLAAKAVGRPVKLVVRREQMFGPLSHRGATRQTLKLGVGERGALTALSHHTLTTTSLHDDFVEPASNASQSLYASPAIRISHEAVRTHIGTPGFMRAPGEATGSIALESAMDEAAHAIGMDPLAFRLANYADVEPISGKAFTSKSLRECYAEGAEAFGWDRRSTEPRSMHDEKGLLVGWGVGSAVFFAGMMQGEARAILKDDGMGRIEVGIHDMGQGAWTALAQVGADALALDLSQVEFVSGDSSLPNGGLAGGSTHTATAGSAIDKAGMAVLGELAALAAANESSPLFGADNTGLSAKDGRLYVSDEPQRSQSYGEILKQAGKTSIEAMGQISSEPHGATDDYARHSHGAVFAEVKVDPDLGQIRVSRMVGAFAAGRVINPRLVESQLYGGMIWGLSFALHEKAVTDARSGRIMNADFAGYHVPVHADVPAMQVIMIPEEDRLVNPLGVKGVGEIGIVGSAGAIANAVWHATGRRIRHFPIGPKDLL